MYVQSFDNRWSHLLFGICGSLLVVVILVYLRDKNHTAVGALISLVFAYTFIGIAGWHQLSKYSSLVYIGLYFTVQTALAVTMLTIDVRLYGESATPTYFIPLFVQVAAFTGLLRWGMWSILIAAAVYVNAQLEYSLGFAVLDALFLSLFGVVGQILVHQTNMRLQLQQLTEELEEQKRTQREDFEDTNAKRNKFIYLATHDLKNPLNIFYGYLSLMESDERILEHDDLKKFVAQMGVSYKKMFKLISDMLALAQIGSDEQITFQEVNLNQLIMIDLSSFRLEAENNNIELTHSLPTEVICIDGDANGLQRVLDNLISNAIKYTPDGGKVMISLKRMGDQVAISVSDTGLGIPQEDISKLFDPFFRVEKLSHYQIEGTGLGLAIVESVAKQHNGSVKVDSKEGVGSTFTLLLPVKQ